MVNQLSINKYLARIPIDSVRWTICWRCAVAFCMASLRRLYVQQRLSSSFRDSHIRLLASFDESRANSTGRQLAPSDQQMVSMRKPLTKRSWLWSQTRHRAVQRIWTGSAHRCCHRLSVQSQADHRLAGRTFWTSEQPIPEAAGANCRSFLWVLRKRRLYRRTNCRWWQYRGRSSGWPPNGKVKMVCIKERTPCPWRFLTPQRCKSEPILKRSKKWSIWPWMRMSAWVGRLSCYEAYRLFLLDIIVDFGEYTIYQKLGPINFFLYVINKLPLFFKSSRKPRKLRYKFQKNRIQDWICPYEMNCALPKREFHWAGCISPCKFFFWQGYMELTEWCARTSKTGWTKVNRHQSKLNIISLKDVVSGICW